MSTDAFTADIQESLIDQIRAVQNREEDFKNQIKDLETEIEQLRLRLSKKDRKLKEIQDQAGRHKEEAWESEDANNALRKQVADLEAQLGSVTHEAENFKNMLVLAAEQAQSQQIELENGNKKFDALTARYENDTNASSRLEERLNSENAEALKEIEGLKNELKQKSRLLRQVQSELSADQDLRSPARAPATFEPALLEVDNSPPGSPQKSPMKGSLEMETMRASLDHSHQMITNLKASLRKAQIEKNEYKKMLVEAQDDLEAANAGNWVDVNTPAKKQRKVVRRRMQSKQDDTISPYASDDDQSFHDMDEEEDNYEDEMSPRRMSSIFASPISPGSEQVTPQRDRDAPRGETLSNIFATPLPSISASASPQGETMSNIFGAVPVRVLSDAETQTDLPDLKDVATDPQILLTTDAAIQCVSTISNIETQTSSPVLVDMHTETINTVHSTAETQTFIPSTHMETQTLQPSLSHIDTQTLLPSLSHIETQTPLATSAHIETQTLPVVVPSTNTVGSGPDEETTVAEQKPSSKDELIVAGAATAATAAIAGTALEKHRSIKDRLSTATIAFGPSSTPDNIREPEETSVAPAVVTATIACGPDDAMTVFEDSSAPPSPLHKDTSDMSTSTADLPPTSPLKEATNRLSKTPATLTVPTSPKSPRTPKSERSDPQTPRASMVIKPDDNSTPKASMMSNASENNSTPKASIQTNSQTNTQTPRSMASLMGLEPLPVKPSVASPRSPRSPTGTATIHPPLIQSHKFTQDMYPSTSDLSVITASTGVQSSQASHRRAAQQTLSGVDPRVVEAVAQTMIGTKFWKTQKTMLGTVTRHQRYFWIMPGWQTLCWSNAPRKRSGGKVKSAKITSVDMVVDHINDPPGLYSRSLLLGTESGKNVYISSTSREQIGNWYTAFNHMIQTNWSSTTMQESMEYDDKHYDDAMSDLASHEAYGDHEHDHELEHEHDPLDFDDPRTCCDGKHNTVRLERRSHLVDFHSLRL